MEPFRLVMKNARIRRGMTLENLGRRIGSQKGYMSGIERGRVRPPGERVIRKLARTLKLNERELLTRAVIEKAPKVIRRDLERKLFPGEA